MRTHKIDRLNVRVNEKERAAINALKAELGLQSDSELVRHLIWQQEQRVLIVETLESILLTLDVLVKRQEDATDDNRHY